MPAISDCLRFQSSPQYVTAPATRNGPKNETVPIETLIRRSRRNCGTSTSAPARNVSTMPANEPMNESQSGIVGWNALPTTTPAASSIRATDSPTSMLIVLATRIVPPRTAASANSLTAPPWSQLWSQSVEAISPGGRLGASLIALGGMLAQDDASTCEGAPSRASSAARISTWRPTKIGVSRSVYRDASVSRNVSIRCMKSAGSSHSNAVMNSWSSMPNEYVVWLWIVANSAPMRMCSSIARCRSSGVNEYQGRALTKGYTTRYGEPFGITRRARRAFVYSEAFVVAR